MKKHIFLLFALIVSAQVSWAELTLKAVTPASDIPAYYAQVDGKSGTNLYNELNIITNVGFSSLGYDGLWDAYPYTDVYPEGHSMAGALWDMYGACPFSPTGGPRCGDYKKECDCVNREHSIPKSWWGKAENDMYSDIFHLVPTDGYVNNRRSNYAFGEVSSATYTYNGCKLGSPKAVSTDKSTLLGTSATTSANPVFEPRDEYKGDFARGYMGMIAKYSNTTYSITSGDGEQIFEAFSSTTHFGFTQYGMVLLMKWHREDPVSQKEIDRNNGIQKTQGNRNPFIDYPYLAEYIWGEHAGEAVDMTKLMPSCDPEFIPEESDGQRNTTDPAIISPKGSIAFGPINVSSSQMKDTTIKAINLTDGNLTLAISNDPNNYFSLSTTSITKAQAEAGYKITITYAPEAEGNHSATLTISGCGVSSHTVTLTGRCTAVHTITWVDAQNTRIAYAATGETLPIPSAPADCSDARVFMGWTASSSVSSEPADLFTTSTATVSEPATYNAVYADKSVEGNGPETATKTTSIAVGDKVIFVCETASKEMTEIGTYGAGTAYSGTPAGTYQFEVCTGSKNDTYAFKNGNNYISWTSGNSLATNTSINANSSWKVSIDANGNATIKNANDESRVLLWNKGAPRFACYSGKSVGNDYYAVQLYKMTGGTTTTYSNYSLKCSEATDVESLYDSSSSAASKILIDGHIFILREDKIYTIQGTLVH